MKELLSNYIKMLKIGFFYKTFLFSFVLMIPLVVRAIFAIDSGIFGILFVLYVCPLITFIAMSEMFGNKYTFCLTLNMRTKDIIKLIYLNTYITYIVYFIITFFISIFIFQKFPILYLLVTIIFLLCANFLFPHLASPELSARTEDQNSKAGMWLFLVSMCMMLFFLIPLLGSFVFDSNIVFYGQLLTIIITSFITVFTTKKSYKATLRKIMRI